MFQKFPANLAELVQAADALRQDTLRQFADLQQQHAKAFKAAGFGALRPVNVALETRDDVTVTVVTIVLPGLNNQDVAINVVDNKLTVQASYPENNPLGLFGDINVSYPLPVNVDLPHVTGELKNGVLTVELPSLPEAAKKVMTVPVR